MITREWSENGQRFRYEGNCIRTQKPGQIKLAYGDERLEMLRAERASQATPEPSRRIRKFFMKILAGEANNN